MAFPHLLRALWRRWPVVLAGMIVTAAAGILAVQQDGTYWSRTNLVFLAPSSTLFPNSLKTSSEDLIITAGLVAKRINGPDTVVKYASPDVTMIGTPDSGSSYWLRLPDSGGQWAPSFSDQFLILEVRAPSREEVAAIQDKVVARVRSELNAMQREQGVAPVNDITLTVTPRPATIYHVTGSRLRALGMIAAVGTGITVAVVVALEIRARRGQLLPDVRALA